MGLQQLAQHFDFLEKRGFGEAVFQFDEAENNPYIEFEGGQRDVRLSLRHRWPTVQLVEWKGDGEERTSTVTELEPDLAAFPALTRKVGFGERLLALIGLSRGDEEADREHDAAGAQLAKRVQEEFPEFVASRQTSV